MFSPLYKILIDFNFSVLQVMGFDSGLAGLVLLVGQLADGASMPIVGIFSDKETKVPCCRNYGRRKTWHLLGRPN